jgi:hypothetical protein
MSVDERLKRAAELQSEAEALRKDVEDNPPQVKRVTYLIEDGPGVYRVGAKDEPEVGDYPYHGPCAHVWADESFFYVSTDDYEGTAMINREALPQLIEALQRLQAHLNQTAQDREGEKAEVTRKTHS